MRTNRMVSVHLYDFGVYCVVVNGHAVRLSIYEMCRFATHPFLFVSPPSPSVPFGPVTHLQ